MITIHVTYSGQSRDLAGVVAESVTLAASSTVADLLTALTLRHEPLRPLFFKSSGAIAGLLVFINDEQSESKDLLHDGATVAIVPPISGG